MGLRRTALVVSAAAAIAMVGSSPGVAAPIPAPADVVAAMAGFDADPQAAMTAWTAWAEGQPMTFTMVDPAFGSKSACRIDAAHVSKCVFSSKGRGGAWRVSEVTYTLADHTTVVSRAAGSMRWVRGNHGIDVNPIAKGQLDTSFDYWLPWQTPGVVVTASTGVDGWHVVRSVNPNRVDMEYPVVVARISPEGTVAQIVGQLCNGATKGTKTIRIQAVAPLTVPPAR